MEYSQLKLWLLLSSGCSHTDVEDAELGICWMKLRCLSFSSLVSEEKGLFSLISEDFLVLALGEGPKISEDKMPH